jgi:hypothetical protein
MGQLLLGAIVLVSVIAAFWLVGRTATAAAERPRSEELALLPSTEGLWGAAKTAMAVGMAVALGIQRDCGPLYCPQVTPHGLVCLIGK